MGRQSLMVPLFALLVAAPLAGQASVAGRAVVEVGEVMSLRVTSGDGASAGVAAGSGEVAAVHLEILSNRPWRLLVLSGSGGDLVGPYPGPSVPAVVVARGAPGRVTVEVEPEWLDPSAQGLSTTGAVRFALAAD